MTDFFGPEGASSPEAFGEQAPQTSAHGDPLLCGIDGLDPANGDGESFRLPLHNEILDVGPPETDVDGDGYMEAVTLQDERGLTVYTDSDGDRAIDRIATVRFDGTYDSWELTNAQESTAFGGFAADAGAVHPITPRWECTGFGRI